MNKPKQTLAAIATVNQVCAIANVATAKSILMIVIAKCATHVEQKTRKTADAPTVNQMMVAVIGVDQMSPVYVNAIIRIIMMMTKIFV